MEGAFWQTAWDDGRIGFHEGNPNDLLVRFGDRLRGRTRVLVPLCGKTEDLVWLAAQGLEVVGVELVAEAVQAFFAEHGLTPTVNVQTGGLTAYAAGAITIFVGDFFAATPAVLGAIDAVYDRAAMVALPPPLRARYVPHLRTLAAPGASLLLITLEYAEGSRQGPPFSISEADVRAAYAGAAIEHLMSRPDTRFATAAPMTEHCYAVTI